MCISVDLLDDNEAKLQIMRRAEPTFSETDASKHTPEYYDKICRNAYFIAATRDAEICGFCALYANDLKTKTAFITLIAVLPGAQKTGVGSELLKSAFEIARDKGMRRMCLEVEKQNTGAIAFYKRGGFTETAENGDTIYMGRDI